MKIAATTPIHGWRLFAGEVGIIVLGVLIALGAQQVAEAVRDRRAAAVTRAAVTQEINERLFILQLRGTAESCVTRRLDELHALLRTWGRTGTFKTPTWVSQAPWLSIDFPRYQSALAAGHLALLDREELSQMGGLVAAMEEFHRIQLRENAAWATLRLLQDGAETLSPTDRTAIRLALQEAANLDYAARLRIRQTLLRAADHGFRPDRQRFDTYAKRIWKDGRYTPAICAPIDTPPSKANALTGQQIPLPF